MSYLPPPPPGPPGGPPGGYGYGPPPKPSRAPQIILGVLIGAVASVIAPFAGLMAVTGDTFVPFFVGVAVVPIVAIALMFSAATRPWGIGILIGWAIVAIVVGGACVALIAALSSSHAAA